MTKTEMLRIMEMNDQDELNELYLKAYEVKADKVGKKAYYRGLIEFSNICTKDCYYCGIRKTSKQERYTMTKDEILEMALWAYENDYGSITLQSGERQDQDNTDFIADVVRAIKQATDGRLGITLCLGEQSEDVYKEWFDSGAHRYLLRIETSNEDLYNKMHPKSELHNFHRRVECLQSLKRIGYQLGTGVMIGLPGQTFDDLVKDILFFEEIDADMIGMGPYVVHKETPMGEEVIANGHDDEKSKAERFTLGLKMIAIARLHLQDVNIVATTAMQALHPFGRELALKAGANILMPIITLREYRRKYQLYDDKPCIDDDASHCKQCLTGRVRSVGDDVGFGEWGDSPHFSRKRCIV